jgi:hypothetical protein
VKEEENMIGGRGGSLFESMSDVRGHNLLSFILSTKISGEKYF